MNQVIFKMDRYGNGEEIIIDKVFDSAGRVPSFIHFDKELFTGNHTHINPSGRYSKYDEKV